MSLSDAIAKMQRAVPSVHDTWNRVEPPQAAPDKAVPPVPPVPPENAKAETVFRLDTGQRGNDINPANDQTPASIDSLPLRLRAAAERVCREVHGDGDEGVAQMLEDLRHYPPDSYPALIRHFEMQLPDDDFDNRRTSYSKYRARSVFAEQLPADFDNRRTCRQCRNLIGAGGCRAAQRGEISTAISTWKPDPERLRRCLWFMPKASEQDQRIGHERWPGLELVPGIATEGTP